MRVALVLDGLTTLVLVPDTFEFFILHINDHIAKQCLVWMNFNKYHFFRSSHQRCSMKKVFLEQLWTTASAFLNLAKTLIDSLMDKETFFDQIC